MGLSSSQARLLSLTARMHDIEYKAQRLEAQKLQMANESRRAYEDYLIALDSAKIQMRTIKTDGSLDYIDANYANLKLAGFDFSENSEYIALIQADIDEFYSAKFNGDINKFAAIKSGFAVENPDGLYVLSTDNNTYIAFDETDFVTLTSENKDIVIMNNLSFDTSNGVITEGYSGNLNGNGNTISVSGKDSLFRILNDGANISNFNLNATIVSDGTFKRGLLSRGTSGSVSISNINLSGQISSNGNYSVGGLVHTNIGSLTVNNIYFDNIKLEYNSENSTESTPAIGGIVSNNSGKLDISDVSGNIEISGGSSTGGIVGKVNEKRSGSSEETETTIQNINIDVTITSNNLYYSGGIVGRNDSSNSVIKNCYVSGTITDSNEEYLAPSNSYSAGIIACMHSGTIECCYSDVIINSSNNKPINTAYILFPNNENLGTFNVKNIAGVNSSNQVCTDKESLISGSTIYTCNFTQEYSAEEIKQIAMTSSNTSSDIEGNIITSPEYEHFKTIGEKIVNNKYFVIDGHENDSNWLANILNSGLVILSKQNNDEDFVDVSVATETDLREIEDTTLLKKAEAKYEADMKKIDLKDRKYDTDLAAIETERNAIKQEIETLKTAAKDNVERTFKLFG